MVDVLEPVVLLELFIQVLDAVGAQAALAPSGAVSGWGAVAVAVALMVALGAAPAPGVGAAAASTSMFLASGRQLLLC